MKAIKLRFRGGGAVLGDQIRGVLGVIGCKSGGAASLNTGFFKHFLILVVHQKMEALHLLMDTSIDASQTKNILPTSMGVHLFFGWYTLKWAASQTGP